MDLFYKTNPFPNTFLIFSLSLCFTYLPMTYFQPNLIQLRNALLLGCELAPQVWHWSHWIRETRHCSFCHTATLSACHSAAWEDSSHWHKGWKQVVGHNVRRVLLWCLSCQTWNAASLPMSWVPFTDKYYNLDSLSMFFNPFWNPSWFCQLAWGIWRNLSISFPLLSPHKQLDLLGWGKKADCPTYQFWFPLHAANSFQIKSFLQKVAILWLLHKKDL